MAADELRAALTLAAYPRSARWDPQWMLDNVMGPNPLWLSEAVAPAGIVAGRRLGIAACLGMTRGKATRVPHESHGRTAIAGTNLRARSTHWAKW